MRSETYRAKAEEMTRLAGLADEGEDRDGYLRLAAIWSEMAQMAEKLEAALAEGKA
jgi:hypothetical protein